MVWRAEDPCGNESAKVMWELPQYTRGRGLDIGCGPSKAFPHMIGVDNYTDTQLFGIQMKPDVVSDCTKLEVFGSASMDFVYSLRKRGPSAVMVPSVMRSKHRASCQH